MHILHEFVCKRIIIFLNIFLVPGVEHFSNTNSSYFKSLFKSELNEDFKF